ncbi:MAG TPA: hypothetical protein DCR43_07300 [Bacteroidales bacterium]|nr:MAG: hypothetical protein A2X11_07945 [Bacteroidetes bacterium GWE2_42_24]OFY26434.1 MAG: hypothetical protein A2X09_02010 [Bacteroidetes bacterium GWF2_43_11]HAQ65640.1 hypothetical protein [Bacteroidales bacterium]HBZ68167.1 hypothetical protein [Bacteroidales bacterium]
MKSQILTMTFPYRSAVTSVFLDIAAIAFVFFVPAMSHLTGIPIYLVEPMRIMVVLALLHSHRYNAWALAIILPAFSFFVSGHPYPIKMVIITAELLLNVFLFHLLIKKITPFAAMLTAIVASKVFYYLLKYVVVVAGMLQMDLFATPILIQMITALVFSGYAYLILHPAKK